MSDDFTPPIGGAHLPRFVVIHDPTTAPADARTFLVVDVVDCDVVDFSSDRGVAERMVDEHSDRVRQQIIKDRVYLTKRESWLLFGCADGYDLRTPGLDKFLLRVLAKELELGRQLETKEVDELFAEHQKANAEIRLALAEEAGT